MPGECLPHRHQERLQSGAMWWLLSAEMRDQLQGEKLSGASLVVGYYGANFVEHLSGDLQAIGVTVS